MLSNKESSSKITCKCRNEETKSILSSSSKIHLTSCQSSLPCQHDFLRIFRITAPRNETNTFIIQISANRITNKVDERLLLLTDEGSVRKAKLSTPKQRIREVPFAASMHAAASSQAAAKLSAVEAADPHSEVERFQLLSQRRKHLLLRGSYEQLESVRLWHHVGSESDERLSGVRVRCRVWQLRIPLLHRTRIQRSAFDGSIACIFCLPASKNLELRKTI